MTHCSTPSCRNEGRYIVEDGRRSCSIHCIGELAIRESDVPELLRQLNTLMRTSVRDNDYPDPRTLIAFRDDWFASRASWKFFARPHEMIDGCSAEYVGPDDLRGLRGSVFTNCRRLSSGRWDVGRDRSLSEHELRRIP
mgnify:CR=1 FL=1